MLMDFPYCITIKYLYHILQIPTMYVYFPYCITIKYLYHKNLNIWLQAHFPYCITIKYLYQSVRYLLPKLELSVLYYH